MSIPLTVGSAFPVFARSIDPGGSTGWRPVEGLTLRDYFAAAALTGIMSETGGDWDDVAVATWAYRLADAMLKARE